MTWYGVPVTGTTYAEVESRRVAIPLGVIDYDQGQISDWTDRRADCSGLISYVWDLPKTGPGTWLNAYTTQSLWEQGLIYEIDRSQLLPGDAIGYCGPGTANGGGGHIALYRANKGDAYRVWDHGSGMGPKDRVVTWNALSTGWLAPDRCKAWRYVNMGAPVGGDPMFLAQTKGTVEVFLCDGMRRRLVKDQTELADIRELAKLGHIVLTNGGQILMVDRIGACGQVADTAAAAPHSHVTGPAVPA